MSATELFKALELLGPKKCRKKSYSFLKSTIYSFVVQDYMYKQQLPSLARGLFMRKVQSEYEIVVRGYDKFFNIDELPSTTWKSIESDTVGPYYVTLKENGCIIFVSQCDDQLLVTSKHSLGPIQDRVSHAEKGKEWLLRHLKATGKTESELVTFLKQENVTAVFELVDDDFEEHVLEYPPEKRGLYLHGINRNTVQFQTLSLAHIAEFGTRFGLRFVDAFEISTVQELMSFAQESMKTGTYRGQAVEGFVVRCKRQEQDFFFKIKFDAPYLMFREWRELTKAIISQRTVQRTRYKLSEKYLEWANKKYHFERQLFQHINQGKGIILLRKLFLQAVNLDPQADGATLVKMQGDLNLDYVPESGHDKMLIIPVATIGSGKTTLARSLSLLYPEMGHIQNDNMTGKRVAHSFIQAIVQAFETKSIVFADRNNHMKKHREQLCEMFRSYYPEGTIVCLNWNIEKYDPKRVVQETVKRVIARGENHQSLTPQNDSFKRVINDFVYHRHPVDPQSESELDIVVEMDLFKDTLIHLKNVCQTLQFEDKSDQEILKAIETAKSWKETVKKHVKEAPPVYYGLRIITPLLAIVQDILHTAGHQDFWNNIKPRMENKSFHCTLVYRNKNADKSMLQYYDKLYKDREQFNKKCQITVEKVMWNDRVLAMKIKSCDPEMPCVHQMHITLATRNDQVKAFESLDLMQQVNCNSIDTPNLILETQLAAFYGSD
ncbi:RNA ligase-domain-containing protein [Gorgonomyces haynaldii]|nr:RNA ligase-domain-containing protein [Gorgonomyces haynaldii]